MRAMVYREYGGHEVLTLQEVAKPAPGNDEVLIEVHAAALNAKDWHLLRGMPLVRPQLGWRRPRPKFRVPGSDVAGRVAAVGRDVTRFAPGDEVFGSCLWGGGFAEYACVPTSRLALKPVAASFAQAAAFPIAAVTALQGLRDVGGVQPGQSVLINGASGGVGTFAVQLARAFGAEVTGVCSGGNAELVRSLGADRIVEYTREDFAASGQRYDLILDAVGNRSVADLARALTPGGICVVVGFTSLGLLFRHMFGGAWVSRGGGKKIRMLDAKIVAADLVVLAELFESGAVVPAIERTLSLPEVPDAMRQLGSRRARGKMIVMTGRPDTPTRPSDSTP